jgi:polysaccharide export outer membrane protein
MICLLSISSLWALTGSASERTGKASVSPGYPVTPGDVYSVSYSLSGSAFSVQLTVDKNYLAQVPGFGKFQTEGMTYYELRGQVEQLVNDLFPGSVPVMTISSSGVFEVLVKGEVQIAQEVPAWSFERLSSIVDAVKTSYTSYRDVEIISKGGSSRIVDLFMGRRTGDVTQNPYLAYGDTIILRPYERQIILRGDVKRPGSYQLKEDENLLDVIEILGDGFTSTADQSQIQISRILGSTEGQGSTFYLNLSDDPEDLPLMDMDSITIPRWTDYRPIVTLQGAIGTSEEGTSVSSRVIVNITEGELLSSVMRKVQAQFTKVSDLEHVSVIRSETGDSVDVNVEELLLTGNRDLDLVLSDRDMVIIPFTQYYVYVTGSVVSPGRFPYIVNKSWDYYMGLAGGFDIDSHSGSRVRITDVYGDKHKQKERIIQPEDVIFAPRNNPIFWIGKYGGDIAILTASLTSLIILTNYMGTLNSNNYTPIPTP